MSFNPALTSSAVTWYSLYYVLNSQGQPCMTPVFWTLRLFLSRVTWTRSCVTFLQKKRSLFKDFERFLKHGKRADPSYGTSFLFFMALQLNIQTYVFPFQLDFMLSVSDTWNLYIYSIAICLCPYPPLPSSQVWACCVACSLGVYSIVTRWCFKLFSTVIDAPLPL